MPNVALIILAAGNSSRMGRPKQLREFNGTTLLAHVVDAGLESNCNSIFVVLGSQIELMTAALVGKSIKIICNENWQEGMASSIAAGIQNLQNSNDNFDATIIATCDQPFVSSELFNALISAFDTSKSKIVASKYNEIAAVPALFDSVYFDELSKLSGSEGARKIIRNNQRQLQTVEFPNGSIDIDTEEEWQNFLQYVDGKSPKISIQY
ncbi:MAG: nucleotidyltransferase family protein [Candidatus Obscuribacterales bacterium]|nr:nucleotidyltransferase family protein [Candidatus Obscuribacterales bacterium]